MHFSFKLKWKNIPQHVFQVWLKRYKLLFFLLFIVVALWSGYDWYHSFAHYSWNPEERQQYLTATVRETSFQEDDFLDVLKHLDNIHEKHQQNETVERDLFLGAQQSE